MAGMLRLSVLANDTLRAFRQRSYRTVSNAANTSSLSQYQAPATAARAGVEPSIASSTPSLIEPPLNRPKNFISAGSNGAMGKIPLVAGPAGR
jgi:hypothetical protein